MLAMILCDINFRDELSVATTDTLQRELESIQELYELEPENKCKYSYLIYNLYLAL